VPGTTEWEGGSSPQLCNVEQSGPTSLVSGVSDGQYGAAAMSLITGKQAPPVFFKSPR
jgi:hypothetical protein